MQRGERAREPILIQQIVLWARLWAIEIRCKLLETEHAWAVNQYGWRKVHKARGYVLCARHSYKGGLRRGRIREREARLVEARDAGGQARLDEVLGGTVEITVAGLDGLCYGHSAEAALEGGAVVAHRCSPSSAPPVQTAQG